MVHRYSSQYIHTDKLHSNCVLAALRIHLFLLLIALSLSFPIFCNPEIRREKKLEFQVKFDLKMKKKTEITFESGYNREFTVSIDSRVYLITHCTHLSRLSAPIVINCCRYCQADINSSVRLLHSFRGFFNFFNIFWKMKSERC